MNRLNLPISQLSPRNPSGHVPLKLFGGIICGENTIVKKPIM